MWIRELAARLRQDHDRRVVLIRLALLISAAALLATSAPPTFDYSFSKQVPGIPVVLTAEVPQAAFLVTVRATGLAPNGKPATGQPMATAQGTISASGVSSSTFVNVSLRGVEPSSAEPDLNVLTSFALSRPFGFSGTCSVPDGCQASFVVDFVRTDGGDNGGELSIDWSLVLSATAPKDQEPDQGPLDPPWTVEVVQQ